MSLKGIFWNPGVNGLKIKQGIMTDKIKIPDANSERWFSLEDLEGEEWKPVVGYEHYWVSSYGRVKTSTYHTNQWKILKTAPRGCTKNYYGVFLWNNGVCKNAATHVLVADAFIRPHKSGEQVNHKDENPHNNCYWNLEWCTQKYNNNYGGRMQRIASALSTPVIAKKIDGGEVLAFNSMAEATKHGYNQSCVCYCCKHKKPQYKGYTWEYLRN